MCFVNSYHKQIKAASANLKYLRQLSFRLIRQVNLRFRIYKFQYFCQFHKCPSFFLFLMLYNAQSANKKTGKEIFRIEERKKCEMRILLSLFMIGMY